MRKERVAYAPAASRHKGTCLVMSEKGHPRSLLEAHREHPGFRYGKCLSVSCIRPPFTQWERRTAYPSVPLPRC